MLLRFNGRILMKVTILCVILMICGLSYSIMKAESYTLVKFPSELDYKMPEETEIEENQIEEIDEKDKGIHPFEKIPHKIVHFDLRNIKKQLNSMKKLSNGRQKIVSKGVFQSRTLKYSKFPAFVTAFSNNHMDEGIQLLDNFTQTFKNTIDPPIIFYDLGLSQSNVKIFKAKYGHRIEFKTFNFSKYPKFVSNLLEYRWKSLVISDSLKEHPGVWWMDASMYFEDYFPYIFKNVIEWAKRSQLSMTMFEPEKYKVSIFAATHPGLYKFMPIPLEKGKQLLQYGTGTVLVNRSEPIINEWVKCALEKECMAPTGSQLCCKFKDKMNDYGKCHRYDQAVVNILLARNCNYISSCYVYQGNCGLGVNRTYRDHLDCYYIEMFMLFLVFSSVALILLNIILILKY